jgi:hypothetical protein
MNVRRLAPLLALVGTFAVAAPASAAVDTQEGESSNWSGYVASGSTSFSSVSGSWVQPTASCSSGDGYSAFWVGLGGASGQTSALEQAGTQADCVNGSPEYYAWYELVPSAPVKLDLAINPGDHISTRVTVNGTNVTVWLADETTGASTTKALQTNNIDTSSAEWIAEAPSQCDGSGNCQPLTLANFGTVKFTSATATAGGHTGSISDPDWSAQAVQLGGSAVDGSGFASDQSSAGAQPSSLSSDGSSFSVAWQSAASQSSSAATDPGSGSAYGYDPGGYGPGGYGGDGYGYVDPGYGYGI